MPKIDLLKELQNYKKKGASIDDVDIDSSDFATQAKKLENDRYGKDTTNRHKLTKWSMWVVSVWLSLV